MSDLPVRRVIVDELDAINASDALRYGRVLRDCGTVVARVTAATTGATEVLVERVASLPVRIENRLEMLITRLKHGLVRL